MATLYRASYSKRYNFIFLVALTIMLGLVVYFRTTLPLIFVIAALIILLPGIIATGIALTSDRPALVVTEEAIIYRPRAFPPIEFTDIVEVTLLPRIHRLSNRKTQNYLREEWRPVVLKLRDYAKYSARVPALLRLGIRDPENPELARIEVPFQGLSGDAREFYRVVSERVQGNLTLGSGA